MATRFSTLCVLTICGAGFLARPAWGDHWNPITPKSCNGIGTRLYSGQLMGIVGSWEKACANKSADVAGVHFDRPTRCVNNAGMWGEFDVPDASCAPSYPAFQARGCRASGLRTYSARLNVPAGSWEDACNRTPLTAGGVHFPRATRCINSGGMWGEVDIQDASCSPSWQTAFQARDCRVPGKRTYSAQLSVPVGDWNAACQAMPATVNGRSYAHADRCVPNGGMWGEIDVDDVACSPSWIAPFRAGQCRDYGKRTFSAQLRVPVGSWDQCGSTPAIVNGQTFAHPDRCVNNAGMWGEFDVNDPTCPHWGSIQANVCSDYGKRQYSGQLLDLPAGKSGEEACARTPADVKGTHFDRPTRCVNDLGMWGEFDIDDAGCRASWSNFFTVCVGRGKATVSAYIEGVPQNRSWETACHTTRATYRGQDIGTPGRCVPDVFILFQTAMKGEWDRPDSSCTGATDAPASSGGAGADSSSTCKPGYAGVTITNGSFHTWHLWLFNANNAPPKDMGVAEPKQSKSEKLDDGAVVAVRFVDVTAINEHNMHSADNKSFFVDPNSWDVGVNYLGAQDQGPITGSKCQPYLVETVP